MTNKPVDAGRESVVPKPVKPSASAPGSSAPSRRALVGGLVAGSAAGLATPALAQGLPELKWRMPLFLPRNVDSVLEAANDFTRRVAEATDGKFQIQMFGTGELVPGGPAVLDAAENGTVECAFTLSYYSFGKDPAYAFGATLPFGFNTRGQAAWLFKGGGLPLLNEFFNARGTHGLPVGNSTMQMGGFFRKEINKVEDLKGLKMRIPGLGGVVMAKLGVVPQQLPPGDIYPALERGVIDAAEWAGPYDDFKFGLHKVAPYYYAPGWWEPQATIMCFVNKKKWDELPKLYKAVLETAATATWTLHVAHYDTINSGGLRNLAAAGAQVRFFSKEILDACYDASFQAFEELKAKSPAFAKIYPHWKKFLDENELYARIGDSSYDNYVYNRRSR
ncbi:TRAP transporter substrate-binding protein [Rhabdaerophilum calidifontis]|uniref:TRAP transporter substrate-binding protein n=1 Tax=Rhabdaerophilum calidifontis TaxID=2604328 RepID=UPI00123B9A98|nr:TRAP transporter substrate-binding protein [Rhabdaerophilum calidifontis]